MRSFLRPAIKTVNSSTFRKMASAAPEQPWHAAFPAPTSMAQFISREETLSLFSKQIPGKDFILVDVRRTDFEGGTIKNSVNFPAHSFYQTREAVYSLLKAAGVKQAIFYCGQCWSVKTGWDYADGPQDHQMDGDRGQALGCRMSSMRRAIPK